MRYLIFLLAIGTTISFAQTTTETDRSAYYYIDGIKFRSSSLPKAKNKEVSVVHAGIPAEHGEVNSCLIRIIKTGRPTLEEGQVIPDSTEYEVDGRRIVSFEITDYTVEPPLVIWKRDWRVPVEAIDQVEVITGGLPCTFGDVEVPAERDSIPVVEYLQPKIEKEMGSNLTVRSCRRNATNDYIDGVKLEKVQTISSSPAQYNIPTTYYQGCCGGIRYYAPDRQTVQIQEADHAFKAPILNGTSADRE